MSADGRWVALKKWKYTLMRFFIEMFSVILGSSYKAGVHFACKIVFKYVFDAKNWRCNVMICSKSLPATVRRVYGQDLNSVGPEIQSN